MLVVVTRRSFRGHRSAPGASLPAGRHTDKPASRSGEPHTASTADNRRRSAHTNTAQPANQGQHRMRGTHAKPRKSASQTAQPRAAHQDFAPADTRKFAVRYLATIRIAAINEWLPRHL